MLDTPPSNQARGPPLRTHAARTWQDPVWRPQRPQGPNDPPSRSCPVPLPPRRALGRHRHQLRARGRPGRRRWTSACSTPTAPSTGTGSRRRPTRSGTAGCPASAPASATATGCTAPTTRCAGLRHNPAKLLLDPYTRAVDGDAHPAPVAVRLRRRRGGQRRPRRPGLRAVRAARRRRPRPVPVGRRPAAAHLVVGHRHLRGARQGRDGAPPGRARRTCAAPTRAWRTRRSSSTCSRWASPPSSCCRCTTSSASRTCCAAG